jgi:hypothetical protein
VLTVLKWMGLALAGLVALALLLLGISWAMPIPAAEREALEAMEAPPAARPPQANAFAAVWLLPYDGIPSAQWEALVDEDVARFREHATGTSVAEGRFARVSPDTRWCRKGEPCLAQVRSHADEVAAVHRGHEALHERIAALTDYRYYRNAFDLDPGVPFPQMAMVLERTPVHALAHVRGDSALALQGVCEDVSSARMLMSDSDMLLVAMVGGAWAERSAALFTDILAELPADVAVPPVCTRAFLPPRLTELDLCQPMRGEFAFQQAAMAELSTSEQVLLDKRKTLARNAWLLSRSCADEVQAQIRQDQRVRLATPPSVWDLSCVANAVGCTLVDIAGPAYDQYPQRMQDVGAQLRMAGAMLWLRGQPHSEGGAADVLARLPSELGSAQRPLRLSDDGRRVEVPRLGPPREGWGPAISAPLPMGW